MKKKPIHIAFCIHSLRAGGAERVMSLLANYLDHIPFYKITIITFTSPGEKPFYKLSPDIHLVCLGGLPKASHSFVKKGVNIIRSIWNFWKTIRQIKPDVIIAFIDIVNFLALILTRGSGIPVVVSERYDPTTYPRNGLIKLLRRFTYPWADKIIVQSSSVAKFFGKDFEEKIQIIGNPVFKPRKITSQEVNESNIHLISVGRLIPSKRMDVVIKVFRKVADHYPKARLTIWGDGPESATLHKIRKDLGLKHNVYLPGTSKEVWEHLTHGHIFLFASESEGFPNALCEAMARGLVPIITDYGSSAKDIIQNGKNGLMVEKNDFEELVRVVIWAVKDKVLRKNISAEALKISDTYSMNCIGKQWEECIRSLRCKTSPSKWVIFKDIQQIFTKNWKILLFIIPIASLIFLIEKQPTGFTKDLLRMLPYSPLLLLVFMFNLLLSPLRMYVLYRKLSIDIPYQKILFAFIKGQLGGLFFHPFLSGLISQTFFLKKETKTVEVHASVFLLDKLIFFCSGFLVLLITLSVVYPSLLKEFFAQNSKVGPLIISLFLSTFLSFKTFFLSVKKWITPKNILFFILLLGIGLCSWVLMGYMFFILFKVFEPFPPVGGTLLSGMGISFLSSMPVSINGWGIREFFCVQFFGELGLPFAESISIGIMVGSISTIGVLVFSALIFYYKKKRRIHGK
jgi:GalNAc-alpha-(1->4)-GalNAc-alpha-(1->3)-diNAcBac-PP-undecaprenol alpha-1,4-N-acetyl-D-galactosaminyltransferase